MKKVFMTLAAVVAIGFGANAQTGDVKFGFKGGYNLANLGGDVENNKALSGFHLGGFVEIPVSEKFAIQPEVLYSAQGAKYEYSETFGGMTLSYKFDDKLDYINIPVMAKYYATDKLALEAGPQFGFLVKAKSDGEDIKDYVKSFDFGLGIGASYFFTENIYAGARYNFGLSNISDDTDADDYKVNNQVLQVSVGYRF
nr:porin family protein [uncultured Flavobacterium sp.]